MELPAASQAKRREGVDMAASMIQLICIEVACLHAMLQLSNILIHFLYFLGIGGSQRLTSLLRGHCEEVILDQDISFYKIIKNPSFCIISALTLKPICSCLLDKCTINYSSPEL